MKKHVKIYLDAHNLHGERIMCQYCNSKEGTDIHHVDNKGMGGSKTKDYEENLIALCRDCHTDAHNEKISKEVFKNIVIRSLCFKQL